MAKQNEPRDINDIVPTVVQYGDITVNHGVQIECSDDGKTLWINVDGVCAIRLCAGPFGQPLPIEISANLVKHGNQLWRA